MKMLVQAVIVGVFAVALLSAAVYGIDCQGHGDLAAVVETT